MTEKTGMCQSCGMPLLKPEDHGTNSDGSQNGIYCIHCYQHGSFAQPDISIEQMTDFSSKIISEMFEMPPEDAKRFVFGQLQHLKRWSGRIIPTCESCGMPLASLSDAGTEKNGSPSARYCTHCYQNGAFTEPNLTRDEMIAKYSPILANEFHIPPDKAVTMVTSFTATLPPVEVKSENHFFSLQ